MRLRLSLLTVGENSQWQDRLRAGDPTAAISRYRSVSWESRPLRNKLRSASVRICTLSFRLQDHCKRTITSLPLGALLLAMTTQHRLRHWRNSWSLSPSVSALQTQWTELYSPNRKLCGSAETHRKKQLCFRFCLFFFHFCLWRARRPRGNLFRLIQVSDPFSRSSGLKQVPPYVFPLWVCYPSCQASNEVHFPRILHRNCIYHHNTIFQRLRVRDGMEK